MLYKNRILKLTTISVMALALAFLPWGAQAQDAGDCIPNGAYSGGFADGQFAGLFWNFVITMHDPEGSRGSVNFNWCTNRIDLFPTHEEYAPMVGDLVRTGPNTWDMTVIGNGADGPVGTGANNLLFISVMSGSCTFSENCDEMYYSGAYAVFQPYQDVNPTDGIPDEGEEPYICFPAESVSHRVKVMPPYALKMPTGPTSVMGDVWVTDDMQSTQNLAGGVDEDVAADRALAVRWYLGGMDCKSYHIYVSDDGAPFAYLCHTENCASNSFLWKSGSQKYMNPAFTSGPQYGHSYSFRVYKVTQSGQPVAVGPFDTAAPVQLVEPPVEVQNVEIVRQFIDEFMNNKNLNFADQVMSPDFVDEDTGMGLEAFKMVFGGTFNAIPDAYVISEDLFASGDKVVHRSTVGGTHMGDLVLGDMNIPATGNSYAMTSICIFQIQDGKITRHWSQMDMLGMLEQLGVMPPSQEFYGWTEPSPVTGDPGDPDANLAIIQNLETVYNQQDLEKIAELLHPDFFYHNPNAQDIVNLEDLTQYFAGLFADFPEQQLTFHNLFAADDKVVGEWSWTAVMPDIGRQISTPGITIYRIVDGKIADMWWISDYMTLGQQMMAPLTAEELGTLTANSLNAFNAYDLDAFSPLYTDDAIYDFVPNPPPTSGKDAFLYVIDEVIYGAFPDYHQEPIRILTSETDQMVVMETYDTGTHLGEFNGIPATGNEFAGGNLLIYEAEGQLLKKLTHYTDMLALLVQLGVMPQGEMPELIPSFMLPDPVPTGLPPLEANAEVLARWNSQDLNHFAEMIHPDGEFMSTLTGTPLNREQFIAILEYFFSASSDLHSVVDRMVELNDGWVLTELRYLGTSTGPYLGLPATGLTYNFRAAILYRIDENGMVTNFENYWDHITLLSQTGQIPTTTADMEAASAIMSDLLRAQDLDHFLNYFTEDCVYRFVPYSPAYEGKDAVRAFFEGVFQTYLNFNPMTSRMFSVDNILVTETDVTGTDSATGIDVLAKPLHIWEFEGSRINKVTEYIDLASVLMQTGMMPPMNLPELTPSIIMPDPEPTGLSPLEANQEAIDRWNSHDLIQYAKILHSEGIYMSAFTGIPLNRDAYIALIEKFFDSTSDLHGEVIRTIELNDGWILTELLYKGTNDGPYFGMPKTDLSYDLRAVFLQRFDENGLLVNLEAYWDQATYLAQTGRMPRIAPFPASEAEMRATMDQMYQAFNSQDLATGVNFWTDDFVYDFVAEPPAMQGKEAGVEFLEGVFEGFPDFHSDAIHDPVSIKDQIMVRDSLLTATHLGEVSGIPATGNQCISRYLIIFQYAGTAISRITEYFDMSSLLIQFGLLPPLQMPPLDPSFTLPDPEPTGLSPLESAQELFGYWKNQEMPQFAARMNPEGEFMTAFGAPLDRGQVIGVLEHMINSSPDMQNKPVRFIDLSDGWVAIEATVQGTQTGPYFGIPGTGNPYNFRWAALYHFDDNGLLTNFELFYDNVTLLTQLGVIPPL